MSLLREELAALEHEQWAHWTAYMLKTLEPLTDQSSEAAVAVARWKQQIATPYAGLTETEKDSDREWADKVIEIFARIIAGRMA